MTCRCVRKRMPAGIGLFAEHARFFRHAVNMNRHYFRDIHLLIAALVLVGVQPMQMVCCCSYCKNHRDTVARVVATSCCHAQKGLSSDRGDNCRCRGLWTTPYRLTKPRCCFGEDNEASKLPCVKETSIASESVSGVRPFARGVLYSFVTRHRCAALCRFLL